MEAKHELRHELQGLNDREKMEKVKNAVKDQLQRISHAKNDAIVKKYHDHVKFGKDGYKVRYYSTKFHVHTPEDQLAF